MTSKKSPDSSTFVAPIPVEDIFSENFYKGVPDQVDLVNAVIASINKDLADPKFVENDGHSFGGIDCYYKFDHQGTLASNDKEYLEQVFKKAGWAVVRSSNSEDDGGNPGMCRVTLYRTKTAHYKCLWSKF